MNDNSGENPAPAADEPSPERVTSINKPRPALVAAGGRPVAIIPRTFEDAYRIGSAAVVGKWAPYGWTKEQATLAILHGAEVGLPPMMSLQKICVINGRPSLWGDAVPAIALATGALEDWSEGIRGEGEGMVAYCVVKRRGIKTPFETTFSVADARRAGLWDERPVVAKSVWDKKKGAKVWKEDAENDSPWYRHPKRMLQMRARRAFRDAFADAFSGLYIAEELDGAPEMRDVTPPSPAIHNPLQDDAEVAADGREPGDEMPPKQVGPIVEKGDDPGIHPIDFASPGMQDALGKTWERHAVVTGGPATLTNPAVEITDPSQDELAASKETAQSVAASSVDEFDEPVAETPQPRQARRKAQDEPKPEPAPKPAPAPKAAAAPAAGDWRKLGAKGCAKHTGAEYLDYLRGWTGTIVDAAAGTVSLSAAEDLRSRFIAERDVRNNLGTMLDADQLAEAKQVASAAYKRLGGA